MSIKVVGVVKKTEIGLVVQKPRQQPSLRAQKAVSLVLNGSSKAAALRKAGFSEAVATQPHKVFASLSVKPLIDPVIAKMQKERDEVMKLMVKKRKNANYAVLAMTLRSLNHDIQVLSGRPTEIIDKPLESEEEAFLRELLARNG